MLVAPLEALCHAEETLVRDAACASANALLRAACTPAQALLHWAPMLLRLCAEGGWFTARVSAAKIFAAVYAGCGARRSAACPSPSLPEPPTAAGRARARARRLRTHKQLASSLTLTLLRHPPPPPSSTPRASFAPQSPPPGPSPPSPRCASCWRRAWRRTTRPWSGARPSAPSASSPRSASERRCARCARGRGRAHAHNAPRRLPAARGARMQRLCPHSPGPETPATAAASPLRASLGCAATLTAPSRRAARASLPPKSVTAKILHCQNAPNNQQKQNKTK